MFISGVIIVRITVVGQKFISKDRRTVVGMPEWIYIYRRRSVGNQGIVGRPVFILSVLSHSIFDVTSACHAAHLYRTVPLSHSIFDVTSACHAAPLYRTVP